MHPLRKIIHLDMDPFYASVKQKDRPELKGKPVIVVGDPNSKSWLIYGNLSFTVPPPQNTPIEVRKEPHPDMMVEIEAIAVIE